MWAWRGPVATCPHHPGTATLTYVVALVLGGLLVLECSPVALPRVIRRVGLARRT